MSQRDSPVLVPMPDGAVSCQATTVAIRGVALAIAGPAGSGKTGLASGLISVGASLICDDMTVFRRRDAVIQAEAPAGAPGLIELRGLGIVPIALAGVRPLAAILILGPSAARLPPHETVDVLGVAIPVIRHPPQADLAAKLTIWMAAFASNEDPI